MDYFETHSFLPILPEYTQIGNRFTISSNFHLTLPLMASSRFSVSFPILTLLPIISFRSIVLQYSFATLKIRSVAPMAYLVSYPSRFQGYSHRKFISAIHFSPILLDLCTISPFSYSISLCKIRSI